MGGASFPTGARGVGEEQAPHVLSTEEVAVASESDKVKSRWEVSGIFIPGCLFIGMGVGWALGQFVVGLFIGLGAGFVLMGIARLIIGR